jgi:hypothetical protein
MAERILLKVSIVMPKKKVKDERGTLSPIARG